MTGVGALFFTIAVLAGGFWLCWRLLDAVEKSDLQKACRVALQAQRKQAATRPLLLHRVSRR